MAVTKITGGSITAGTKTLTVADTGNAETVKIQIDWVDTSDRYIHKALDIDVSRSDIPAFIALLEGVLG